MTTFFVPLDGLPRRRGLAALWGCGAFIAGSIGGLWWAARTLLHIAI